MMVAEVVLPESSVDAIQAAISGLAASAAVELAENPAIPSLRDAAASGLVVYRKEPADKQTWLTPAQVIARGWGDCKHFSAWRVGELRNAGRDAMISVIDRRDDDHPGRFHAVVDHDEGTDDPSLEVLALEQWRRDAGITPNKPRKRTMGDENMRTEFKIKPNGGAYSAAVSVPVGRGNRIAFASVGDTRASALDRVMSAMDSLLQDPVVMALVPPPALAVLQGTKVIARAAREGRLDDLLTATQHPASDPVHKQIASKLLTEGLSRRAGKRASPSHSGMDDLGSTLVNIRGDQCTWRDADGSTFSGQCPASMIPAAHGPAAAGARPTSRAAAPVDRFGHPIGGGGASFHPSAPRSMPALPSSRGRTMPTGGSATSSRSSSSSPSSHATPLIDPATGGPMLDPSTGQPYDASGMPDGMPDPSGQYVWSTNPVGHWERARASQQPDPSTVPGGGDPMDPAGYYDPTNPDGYYGGWPPPSPNYPYDFNAGADPYGAWQDDMQPWVYPNAQPFAPWSGHGNPSGGPAWSTSEYPPPFGDQGVLMPPPSSSAFYSQGGTEYLFNGGGGYPDESWVDEFGYGDNGFMADVGSAPRHTYSDLACAGGDPGRADLLACARDSQWSEEQPHESGLVSDVVDVIDDVAGVAEVE